MSSDASKDSSLGSAPIGAFCSQLAAKVPTPGGGAAAAVSAALGSAAACMSAAYTQRKKDVDNGAAVLAKMLSAKLEQGALDALAAGDADAAAYAALQRSWKDSDMAAEQRAAIEAEALRVPVDLIRLCHRHVEAIEAFIPHCNPQITSDAKVGIHLLAGAARAAFQTALVNKPSEADTNSLRRLLEDIRAAEDRALGLQMRVDRGW